MAAARSDNSIAMVGAIGGESGGMPVIAADSSGTMNAVVAAGFGPTKNPKATSGKYMGMNTCPRWNRWNMPGSNAAAPNRPE